MPTLGLFLPLELKLMRFALPFCGLISLFSPFWGKVSVPPSTSALTAWLLAMLLQGIGVRENISFFNVPIVLLYIGLKLGHRFMLDGSMSQHILAIRGMRQLMPSLGLRLLLGFPLLCCNPFKTDLLSLKYTGFGLWNLPRALDLWSLMELCKYWHRSLCAMLLRLIITHFINVEHLSILLVSAFLFAYAVRLPMFWLLVALASRRDWKHCFGVLHEKTFTLLVFKKLDRNSKDTSYWRITTSFLPLPRRKVLEDVKFGSNAAGSLQLALFISNMPTWGSCTPVRNVLLCNCTRMTCASSWLLVMDRRVLRQRIRLPGGQRLLTLFLLPSAIGPLLPFLMPMLELALWSHIVLATLELRLKTMWAHVCINGCMILTLYFRRRLMPTTQVIIRLGDTVQVKKPGLIMLPFRMTSFQLMLVHRLLLWTSPSPSRITLVSFVKFFYIVWLQLASLCTWERLMTPLRYRYLCLVHLGILMCTHMLPIFNCGWSRPCQHAPKPSSAKSTWVMKRGSWFVWRNTIGWGAGSCDALFAIAFFERFFTNGATRTPRPRMPYVHGYVLLTVQLLFMNGVIVSFALMSPHMFAMMTNCSIRSLPNHKVTLRRMKVSMDCGGASNTFCLRMLPRHAPISDAKALAVMLLLNIIVHLKLASPFHMMIYCAAVPKDSLTILLNSLFKLPSLSSPHESKLKLFVSKLNEVERLDLMLFLLKCFKVWSHFLPTPSLTWCSRLGWV